MNKKQMSELLETEYEAWLAGKAQPSALFQKPVHKLRSPVTPKILPVKKPKTVKPQRINKQKIAKPKNPLIQDAIFRVLTEPMQPIEVAQIVSEQIDVNRMSVLNVITQLVKVGHLHRKRVRLAAKVATAVALDSETLDNAIAQIEKRGYAEHFKAVIDAVGDGAKLSDIARKLNLSRSDVRTRLMRLVEIGILRREGFLYEQI